MTRGLRLSDEPRFWLARQSDVRRLGLGALLLVAAAACGLSVPTTSPDELSIPAPSVPQGCSPVA